MRFENSICRYEEDAVIRRVFDLMGNPMPPPGKARAVLEELLKRGAYEKMAAVAASPARRSELFAERAQMIDLLLMVSSPPIEPTTAQVTDNKQVGRSLCVASMLRKCSVEIHAGIGAIFYRGENGTLFSQVAPITGSGMSMRQNYLLSVIETTRDTLEKTFS